MKTGRPLLLPERLDTLVQEYIKELRKRGATVSTAVVVATARGYHRSRVIIKNFTGTLKFAKVYFAKGYFVVDSPKLQPANVSLYTVYQDS